MAFMRKARKWFTFTPIACRHPSRCWLRCHAFVAFTSNCLAMLVTRRLNTERNASRRTPLRARPYEPSLPVSSEFLHMRQRSVIIRGSIAIQAHSFRRRGISDVGRRLGRRNRILKLEDFFSSSCRERCTNMMNGRFSRSNDPRVDPRSQAGLHTASRG